MKAMIIDHQYGMDTILAEGSLEECLVAYRKEVSFYRERGNSLFPTTVGDIRFNTVKAMQFPTRWKWIAIVEDKQKRGAK